MRIRILRPPFPASVDGIRLDGFRVGEVYDVGHTVGSFLLAHRWAEVPDETPDDVARESPISIDPSVRVSAGTSGEDERSARNLARVPETDRRDPRRPDRRQSRIGGRRNSDRRT